MKNLHITKPLICFYNNIEYSSLQNFTNQGEKYGFKQFTETSNLYKKYRFPDSNDPLVENNKLVLGIYIQSYQNLSNINTEGIKIFNIKKYH